MKGRFGAAVELTEGRGGVFKVWLDGALIWDKQEAGRFPDESDIFHRIDGKTTG